MWTPARCPHSDDVSGVAVVCGSIVEIWCPVVESKWIRGRPIGSSMIRRTRTRISNLKEISTISRSCSIGRSWQPKPETKQRRQLKPMRRRRLNKLRLRLRLNGDCRPSRRRRPIQQVEGKPWDPIPGLAPLPPLQRPKLGFVLLPSLFPSAYVFNLSPHVSHLAGVVLSTYSLTLTCTFTPWTS